MTLECLCNTPVTPLSQKQQETQQIKEAVKEVAKAAVKAAGRGI
jgi:hypothetical protein